MLTLVVLEIKIYETEPKCCHGASYAMEQVRILTEIAYGLFSAVATLEYVPIIRCPKVSTCTSSCTGNSFSLSTKRHTTGRRSRNGGLQTQQYDCRTPHTHEKCQGCRRSLLDLQDRNSDLMTPIQHSARVHLSSVD